MQLLEFAKERFVVANIDRSRGNFPKNICKSFFLSI